MITSLACAFAVSTLFAALEPLAPCAGKVVQLVPDAQKKVMNLPTLEERIGLFAEDCATGGRISRDPNWRKSLPLVLEVKTTKGEKGPWKVMIGRKSDLSDARVWYLPTAGAGAATASEIVNGVTQSVVRIEVPRANLEIATRYYWKVVCRGRCGGLDWYFCGPKHGCRECKTVVEPPSRNSSPRTSRRGGSPSRVVSATSATSADASGWAAGVSGRGSCIAGRG